MIFAERHIYLVGPNKLQNELLALFIAGKTSAGCFVESTLSRVPLVSCENRQKRLILYDCRNGRQDLEKLIESDLKNMLTSDYVVLFNLARAMNIENEALKNKVRGFLYEHDGTAALLKMIEAVFNSEIWVSRIVMTEYLFTNGLKMPSNSNTTLSGLTSREIEILNSITMGYSNTEIADKLCISPHTVKTHIYHLFKKIKVSSRFQATRWALDHL